jgi:DNA ligase-1
MKKRLYLLLLFTLLQSDALYIQKPKVYKGDENITGWFMSEKLDGIRAYWTGKELKTKNGNIINAPKWFTKGLGAFELDGELWTKRGDFENIQSIVLDKVPSKKWQEITYKIFEVPNQDGNFSQRLKYAENNIHSSYIQIIKQIECKNRDHLQKYLKQIENFGGEGVIVKNPKLTYFTGRSSEILKVKNFDDMEGQVIATNKGKGKFKDLMGSLTLELENGIVFKLGGGFDLNDRRNPPPLHSIVTFKYYGFTKNCKPKFASFLRKRRKE